MHCQRRLRGIAAFVMPVALAVWAPAPAQSQTGVITGQVLDASSGRPLSDAHVSVTGTGIVKLTNVAGRFTLFNVPVGEHVVRATFIGYGEAEQIVTVGAGETHDIDFEMLLTAIALDVIVVTGVGAETARRALGTSVEVLTTEDIAQASVQSVDQLLVGRVAGATVNATSAQPGTGSLINFRGISSVFGAQTPVIYVDGVRVDNEQATAAGTGGEQSSALADLLTSDIDRIEITRGGAASTLYGSDAATGVIQIVTRKGASGAPRITVRVEQGIEAPELKYIFDAGAIFPDRVESGEVTATFLEDQHFKSGQARSYYLGVSGGTADVTFNVSGRLEDRTGTQPKDASTNYNLRGACKRPSARISPWSFRAVTSTTTSNGSITVPPSRIPLRPSRSATPFSSREPPPPGGVQRLPDAGHRRMGQPVHLLRRRQLEHPRRPDRQADGG